MTLCFCTQSAFGACIQSLSASTFPTHCGAVLCSSSFSSNCKGLTNSSTLILLCFLITRRSTCSSTLLHLRGLIRDLPRHWIRSEWPPEQKDVWLRTVDLVVDPASTLLDAEVAPFILFQKTLSTREFEHLLRYSLWKNHVAVLIPVVLVLLGVLDLIRIVWHCF